MPPEADQPWRRQLHSAERLAWMLWLSACREERLSKRQRNNIAVKKCREKAKVEHRRNAEKLSKIPGIVECMRCLLKRINADANNIIMLNELNYFCDRLLWTYTNYVFCIFCAIKIVQQLKRFFIINIVGIPIQHKISDFGTRYGQQYLWYLFWKVLVR